MINFIPSQKNLLLCCLLLAISFQSIAATFKGTIKNADGEPLPFASIYVKNTALGTNSNEVGAFAISLDAGTYDIVFRYLGYETLVKVITIGTNDLTQEIVLKPTVILLNEATVGNKNEDPALSIMRKTVAMSEIHFKELSAYSFRTYIKGSMKIIDTPLMIDKILEKQYIKKNQLYIFEYINDVSFKQPNTISQRVIAKKDNLPPTLGSSVDIQGGVGKFDFYNPKNETSPVTVKGVRKYNFEYLGYFEENGKVINKIKVTPKRNADDLVAGVLNIVDGTWYVHSYNFKSKTSNSSLSEKVTYEEIEGVWIPNSYVYDVAFDYLGFEVKGAAAVSFKNVKITKNPAYANLKPVIIDDKSFKNEKVMADVKKSASKQKDQLTIQDLMQLKKEIAKEEKAEARKNNQQDIDGIINYSVDSLATKRDSSFWSIERQIPLMPYEIKGFQQADSIVRVNIVDITKKLAKDSLEKARPNKFDIAHLLSGNTYRYGLVKDSVADYHINNFTIGNFTKDTRFNAVEGYTIGIPELRFTRKFSTLNSLAFGVKTYYSFQRKRLNGDLHAAYKTELFSITATGGRRVFQLNEDNPVSTVFNEFYALVFGTHYGKFYENTYGKINLTFQPAARWEIGTNLRFSNRTFLENIVTQGWFKKESFFESNTFAHVNGTSSAFPKNTLSTWSVQVAYAPRATISYRNNNKQLNNQDTPRFTLTNTIAFGKGKYNVVDLSAIHTEEIANSRFNTRLNVGFFYGQKPTYLLDYKHFNGNLPLFTEGSDFRNLDYYLFSSDKSYLTWFNELLPNKFILSSIPFVKKRSISDYVFYNLLLNPYISHQEFGYGVNFLGFLKTEGIADYNNGRFNQFSFRLRLSLPF